MYYLCRIKHYYLFTGGLQIRTDADGYGGIRTDTGGYGRIRPDTNGYRFMLFGQQFISILISILIQAISIDTIRYGLTTIGMNLISIEVQSYKGTSCGIIWHDFFLVSGR